MEEIEGQVYSKKLVAIREPGDMSLIVAKASENLRALGLLTLLFFIPFSVFSNYSVKYFLSIVLPLQFYK